MSKFTILVINNDETKIIETDDTNFTSDIVEGIGVDICKKSSIHTSVIHEEYDKIWQISYINDTNEDNINHTASLLSLDNKTICYNVILFCSKVNDNGSCDTMSITIDDLKQLVQIKKQHIGCHIDIKNMISEFTYSNISDVISDKYEYYPTTLFGFDLELYSEKKNESKIVNKFMSSIVKKLMYGDVYIIHKLGEHTYGNINIKLLTELKQLYHTPINLQIITDKETEVERDTRGLLVVKNRWWMLKKKMNEFKDKIGKCWICNEYTKLTCSGCYRLHYCSKECQRKDWNNHKDDCLKMK